MDIGVRSARSGIRHSALRLYSTIRTWSVRCTHSSVYSPDTSHHSPVTNKYSPDTRLFCFQGSVISIHNYYYYGIGYVMVNVYRIRGGFFNELNYDVAWTNPGRNSHRPIIFDVLAAKNYTIYTSQWYFICDIQQNGKFHRMRLKI